VPALGEVGAMKPLGGADKVGATEAAGTREVGALVTGAPMTGALDSGTLVAPAAGTVGPKPTTGGLGLGVKMGGPTGIGGAVRFAPVSQSQNGPAMADDVPRVSTSAATNERILHIDNICFFMIAFHPGAAARRT
jgi:hypothetical protein